MVFSYQAKVPEKGECQCPASMRESHTGQGFSMNTGHSSAREIVELGVAGQHLDHADVHLLFEQVCRETVALIPRSELAA
jgi:hypothetical protein